jgi:hypothetical protein
VAEYQREQEKKSSKEEIRKYKPSIAVIEVKHACPPCTLACIDAKIPPMAVPTAHAAAAS